MVRQKDKYTLSSSAQILAASLTCASQMPWEQVSFLEIAHCAKMSVADVQKLFPTKQEIVHQIVRNMDAGVWASYCYDPAESKRDQVFELLMERFDAMAEHRDAHISFLKSFGWNQCDKPADMRLYVQSIEHYLRAAGVETSGFGGAAKIAAFSVAYLWVLWVWMGDDRPDLPKTMAALDKVLTRLEWISGYLKRRYGDQII